MHVIITYLLNKATLLHKLIKMRYIGSDLIYHVTIDHMLILFNKLA